MYAIQSPYANKSGGKGTEWESFKGYGRSVPEKRICSKFQKGMRM